MIMRFFVLFSWRCLFEKVNAVDTINTFVGKFEESREGPQRSAGAEAVGRGRQAVVGEEPGKGAEDLLPQASRQQLET